MKCPTCGKDLRRMVAGGVSVDWCEAGCGGMWFDNRELEKFDEPKQWQSEGEALLNWDKEQWAQSDQNGDRWCPKCSKTTMMKHMWSPEWQVEVDECPDCGGVWLDCGQLSWIRNQWDNEKEWKRAAEDYYRDLFGTWLSPWSSESDEKMWMARRLANMFRFVCPTWCAPKEQQWQQWWPHWS
jgi:Zn-finger nucleic acid-binding protein